MILRRKKKIAFLPRIAVFLFFLNCSGGGVFTDVTLRVDNLEEVFPSEFKNNKSVFIEIKNSFDIKFDQRLSAHYGTEASLTAWDCDSPEISQKNWETVKESLLKSGLRYYDIKKTRDYRFDFKKNDEIVGILWTNKKYLFLAEAIDSKSLQKFLASTAIAKVK
ncbi:MAG: hypothetical protein OEZ13_03380 [Spirochaetia bacterium]|nr:hypothetical protein [Spirochaetia bacterium]